MAMTGEEDTVEVDPLDRIEKRLAEIVDDMGRLATGIRVLIRAEAARTRQHIDRQFRNLIEQEQAMALTAADLTNKLTALGTDLATLIAKEAAEEAGEANLPAGSVAVPQDTIDALGAHVDQLESQVSAALNGQPVAPPAPAAPSAGA